MLTYLYIEIDMIGIALLALLFFGKKHSGAQIQEQIIFDYILLFLTVILLCDATIWAIDGKPGFVFTAIDYAASIIYNILGPITGLLWLLYCKYNVIPELGLLYKKMPLYAAPAIINTLLSFVSLFNGCLFYIDANNVYHRGNLFVVNGVINFFYLFAAAYICLKSAHKQENLTKRNELYYMSAFLVPPIIGGIIQVSSYGVSLIWIATALSLLMVYLNVQSHMISMDALTGTNNRWQMNRYLGQKVKNISNGMYLYVYMIDMDDFKKINDTFGHQTGDEAIIEVANILKKSCAGTHDFLARLGGDEFVIISEKSSPDESKTVVDNLLSLINDFNENAGKPYQLALSVGYYGKQAGDGEITADNLLREADSQMYAVKAEHHKQRA